MPFPLGENAFFRCGSEAAAIQVLRVRQAWRRAGLHPVPFRQVLARGAGGSGKQIHRPRPSTASTANFRQTQMGVVHPMPASRADNAPRFRQAQRYVAVPKPGRRGAVLHLPVQLGRRQKRISAAYLANQWRQFDVAVEGIPEAAPVVRLMEIAENAKGHRHGGGGRKNCRRRSETFPPCGGNDLARWGQRGE